MRLCLVEDGAVGRLEPLTLTRPVFDLRLGMTTLGHKIARALGIGPGPARRGVVVRPYLAAIQAARDPRTPINDPDWLARSQSRTLVVNGRWLPPEVDAPGDAASGAGPFGLDFAAGDWVALCDGQPAAAWVGPAEAIGLATGNVDGWFEELLSRRDLANVDLPGTWIETPWDLVTRNPHQIEEDLRLEARPEVSNRQLTAASVLGPVRGLSLHESARIEPFVVLDTSSGPIRLASGVVIRSFSRIEGPCVIGQDAEILRADLRGGVSIGPRCRVGGTIESSVLLAGVRAPHVSYLAGSYVGETVTIGASATVDADPIGSIVGDHARLAAGTLLAPGTVVGIYAEVEPSGAAESGLVPSFSARRRGKLTPLPPPVGQSSAHPAEPPLWLELHERTRLERERALHRPEKDKDKEDAWLLGHG